MWTGLVWLRSGHSNGILRTFVFRESREFVDTTSRHQLERRFFFFFATILHAVVHSSTHKPHIE